MLKNTFVSKKKRRRQTLMTLLINLVLFSFEMRKYASFDEMNIILMIITKVQVLCYPSSKFCNSYLLKNFTLIKALFFLIKHFSSLYTDFTCNVFFSFFDFLIPMTTETTHNQCSFQVCALYVFYKKMSFRNRKTLRKC